MKYQQLNVEERSALATLKRLGWSVAEMARELGRHRSTVARELRRNAAPHDGWYRAGRAHERAVARRRRSRRNSQFGKAELARVEELLREEWSPEQVAGYLRSRGELSISHATNLPACVAGAQEGRQPAPAPALCAKAMSETLRAAR